MSYCTTSPPWSKLLSAFSFWLLVALSIGVPQSVFAISTSSVHADALLGVDISAGANVEVLSFINDDGTNPFTTFTSFDPLGITESSAAATGNVTFGAGNRVFLATSAYAQAAGAPEPSIEVAWSQSAVDAGFFLINTASVATSIPVSVAWSWNVLLAAAGSPIDLGIGQVLIDLLVDGSIFKTIEAVSVDTPPGSSSPTGQFSTLLDLGAYEMRTVNMSVTSLAVAQSTIPTTVPEPAAFWLLGTGLIGLMGMRKRFTK